MKDKLEFKPTKTWIKQHQYRPEECEDKECYCIIDHFNKHSYGFCAGIKLNNDGDLDIISFCDITFNILDKEKDESESRRYLWHPNEALWIATCLNLTVINALYMMPNHRKQLGYLNRRRTRIVNKRNNGQKLP